MKRKAILIEASDVKGQKDLPGARVDIDNWELFLKSDYGGLWTSEEIKILRKPFPSAVKTVLEVSSDCYCFVAFSGHGENGSVVLNDYYDSFPVSDMKPKGDKGTLIVDSCRGITVAAARQYSFARMQKFANESREEIIALNSREGQALAHLEKAEGVKAARTANAHMVRWAAALRDAAKGVVEMYSCSKGEGAGEDPNSGGYYTSLLLQSADAWTKTSTVDKIHWTKDAHDYAVIKLPPQQHPEYKPTWLKFPIAAKE